VVKSEDIAERFWSLPSKPGEETCREQLFLDDVIHKAHCDREIESGLDGVKSALDVGAGTGRFSLRLAARGIQVTHLDISNGMIARARELAQEAGLLGNIAFRHGRLSDVADYPPASFDLVICFDAPVSYAYPDHEKAIAELVRVCAKRIVLSVSSRLGYLHTCLNPIQKEPYFAVPDSQHPLVRFYRQKGRDRLSENDSQISLAQDALKTGLLSPPGETENAYQTGASPWPHNYLFLPDELERLLLVNGVSGIRLSGPGALSRGLPNEVLRTLLMTDEYRQSFLDLCYAFDSQPGACGLGKDNLVASGYVTEPRP
jgi:2-polyprenyl-3-methyl-5-hydroxy-6-metoxy-1,4-benzoquinol methylase